MNLNTVYQMLEDEESRDIYLNRLNYLVSNDFKYLHRIADLYVTQVAPWNEDTLKESIERLPGDRDFVLYGAGKMGAMFLPYCKDSNRFAGFCCKTEYKQKNGYLGYPAISPEKLLSQRDLNVVVSAAGQARSEIMQILKDGAYPKDQIFDGTTFWHSSIDEGQYFNPDFMTYEEEEIFVDAGCFDLSTSLKLKEYCKCVKKVYAFEPDPQCYHRCLARKECTKFAEANIFPFGTWSERTVLHFDAGADGSSRIIEGGDIAVPVMPIDEAVEAGDRVTFIKMDVEGAELESLKGAKKTIQRDKPKLAICIYHKPEDMVTIPLYIKELVPEYKLYIRHHSNSSCETVLYAVMS